MLLSLFCPILFFVNLFWNIVPVRIANLKHGKDMYKPHIKRAYYTARVFMDSDLANKKTPKESSA